MYIYHMNKFIYITDTHLEIHYAFHTIHYELDVFEKYWKENWADSYPEYLESDSNGPVPSSEDEIPYEEVRWDLMSNTELYDFVSDFTLNNDHINVQPIIL